jgi:hypothetical protein
MTDIVTVTLAGEVFTISPLTLGQIIDLKIAVNRPTALDVQEEVRRAYLRSLDIVTAALKIGHPDVNPAWLMNSTTSLGELNSAVTTILDISGLAPKEKKEGETGEVKAAAESTGDAS